MAAWQQKNTPLRLVSIHLVPRRGVHVGHVREEAHAGVVDQDVEPAERCDRPRDRGVRLRLLADVRADGVHARARPPAADSFPRAASRCAVIAARDDDAGAGVEEPFGNREADARGSRR